VQGSGKGTQSQLLAADLDLVHISVGDILRWNVQNHTKLGAQVRRVMAAGELVSDDAVDSVSGTGWPSTTGTTASSSTGSRGTGGRPSSSWKSYDIDRVIELDLPDSEVRRRVLNRRLCASCGLDYNLIAHSRGARAVRPVRGSPRHQGR